MNIAEAKALLQEAEGDEEPVILPQGVLSGLAASDLSAGVRVQVGLIKKDVINLEWSGCLFVDEGFVSGEAEYIWTRKYWYEPINLEHFIDLVRRAVEVRARDHGDVELIHFEDDGAYIHLSYTITTYETNLRLAFRRIRLVSSTLEETAAAASAEAGKRLAEIASRVSGWGTKSLYILVDAVEKASSNDQRGRSLEELVARLFDSISGFSITSRIRTATEEIDILVLNDNADPRFRREAAILLVECKNWSSKCGKNEFVIFRQKIENRKKRCTLGFLVSWNGFATTITKEILRGSREETLVVPVTGRDIRAAVRDGNIFDVLVRCWDEAVSL